MDQVLTKPHGGSTGHPNYTGANSTCFRYPELKRVLCLECPMPSCGPKDHPKLINWKSTPVQIPDQLKGINLEISYRGSTDFNLRDAI